MRRFSSPCWAARYGRPQSPRRSRARLWRRGPRRLAEWFGEALAPARGYLETTYRSDAVRDLWAPWVLHTGLGPESAYSAAMAKVIAFAVEAAGCPIAVGGAKTLLAAFERLIVDQGGAVRPNADVVRIIPGPGSRASGVELASGEKITAAKGVICSTGPDNFTTACSRIGPYRRLPRSGEA